MTEPNEFRRRRERQKNHWRIAIKIIDALTALALAVVAALVLKMILY